MGDEMRQEGSQKQRDWRPDSEPMLELEVGKWGMARSGVGTRLGVILVGSCILPMC